MSKHRKPLPSKAREAKRPYVWLGVFLMLCVIICTAGCARKDEGGQGSGAEPNATQVATDVGFEPPVETPTLPATPSKPDAVVVTVNGRNIMASELERRVDIKFAQVKTKTAHLPPQFREQVRGQLRDNELQQMIVEVLLVAEADKLDITVTDQDVTDHLQKMFSRGGPPPPMDRIKAVIEAQGATLDEVRDQIRKGIMISRLVEKQQAGKVDVTQEEAQKYYDEHPDEFKIPEQIRASHILIAPDPNADPNEAKTVARAKAEELLQQVKGGADFAELAKAHSACPSKARGGDLSFFPRGKMVKPFEDAAFALQPGQVTDVVETEFGFHIIKVTDRKEPTTATLEDVKDTLIQRLVQNKQNEISRDYIQSLRQKAQIVYPGGAAPPSAAPPSAAPPSAAPAPAGQ